MCKLSSVVGQIATEAHARIAFRRDGYLRRYVYEFIELFAPHLTREVVERSRSGEADAYVI